MKKKLHMAAMLLAFCTLAACNDDETDMGSTLMDANIIYNGNLRPDKLTDIDLGSKIALTLYIYSTP